MDKTLKERMLDNQEVNWDSYEHAKSYFTHYVMNLVSYKIIDSPELNELCGTFEEIRKELLGDDCNA